MRLWDVEMGTCLRVLKCQSRVKAVTLSTDQRRALSGSADGAVRLWDMEVGRSLRVFEGHSGTVRCVAWSADQRQALSGSNDKTLRLWDVETGRCLRVLEGHTNRVWSVAWSPDKSLALSSSANKTVQVWDVREGRCLQVIKGHSAGVLSVALSADFSVFSCDTFGDIRVWDLPRILATLRARAPKQIQYTNAKVLLVGESGAGKTGLTERLAQDTFTPSYSTSGTWSTQWNMKDLPVQEVWE